jgi:hypothetical protein
MGVGLVKAHSGVVKSEIPSCHRRVNLGFSNEFAGVYRIGRVGVQLFARDKYLFMHQRLRKIAVFPVDDVDSSPRPLVSLP